MRRLLLFSSLFSVILILGIASGASPADAQTTGVNFTWASLDPGNDWAATTIKNIFPTDQATATTVIGQIIGQLTGFVLAIAMFWICYSLIINIHRVAETARLMTDSMSWLAVVRIGFAAILMFPLSNGFSNGQLLVQKVALWGIGMGKAVYTNAVQAIGPDALVIAQPMIPGTGTIVLGLIQNEFCAALINAAAANTGLVPTPSAIYGEQNGDLLSTYLTWSYSFANGNETGTPVCGSVALRKTLGGATNIAGVSIDVLANQQQILEQVLQNDIRPQVQNIANQFWQNKQASSLNSLLQVYQSATSDYTSQLTSTASQITSQLRSALSDPTQARDGNLGLISNETQLSTLGWTSAGAYYLEIARLNGLTSSLLYAVPVVNAPSLDGMSQSLREDFAPLYSSALAYLTKLQTYVTTSDGLQSPSGNASLFSGATPGEDGGSTIEKLFRSLSLNEKLLQIFTDQMSPTSANWVDPFGGLMQLGNKLITIALTALGTAGLLSSKTASIGATILQFVSGNVTGAAATMVGSAIVQFFSIPIFLACLALLIPGLTIAYVLPMIPWVMWMAGVCGYLILVCEAMVAVPLWMLAHMTMEGAGLHGRAQEGYSLLFNLLFRPTLMIFGLFLGYTIFSAMSWLIRMSFGVAASFVLASGWMVSNVLGVFVLLSIYVMVHIIAAMASFRLISLMPHHLPRLLGFASANRVDMDQFSREAAWVGVGGALGNIQRGMRNGALAARGREPYQLGYQRKLTHSKAGDEASTQQSGMDSTLRAATETSSSNTTEG